MHYTGGHTDRQLQLHRVRESAQVAVRNTSDGVAESADVMTPDWKLGLEVQVWVGLGLLSLPSGCVEAVLSLCPHRVIPLSVSVSSSPLLMRTPVLQDQDPPHDLSLP